MKKKYQIFLCEDFFLASEDTAEFTNGLFVDKRVCEIASDTSEFQGQANNIKFYTKIDGTHELTFNLPRYYFNEETGKNEINQLVELVVNKSKLELIKEDSNGELKSFFMVVNSKDDSNENGVLSYSYTCTDAFIEELSKNGYGLSFSDEVDGGGLGTIHELSNKITDNTDWTYRGDKTGPLYEYTTDLKYNVEQQRYDKVYKPVPVHPIKYIPELNRYCYELEILRKKDNDYHRIYCYDDTQQITANSVQNLLYNANEFVDTIGWQSYINNNGQITEGYIVEPEMEKIEDKMNFYLHTYPLSGQAKTFLLNDTVSGSSKYLKADVPYAFRWDSKNGNYSGIKSPIKAIHIYNKNPLINKDILPDYSYSPANGIGEGKYISLKFKTGFSTPYVVLEIDADVSIKDIYLFEVKGKKTDEDTAENNNLILLSSLVNGEIISENLVSLMQLPLGAPESTGEALSAYTHKYVQYFIRDNYKTELKINQLTGKNYIEENKIDDLKEEDTLTYLDFETEINVRNNYVIIKTEDGNFSFTEYYKIESTETGNKQIWPRPIKIVDNLPLEVEADLNSIYLLKTDNKYYQYYSIQRDGVIGGKWGYALFGDGANDKRRTLVASKSNRFNLIQDLAELFKVWPVFNIYREEDTGKIIKEFWFKENCIRKNFSGFHNGINLQGLKRVSNSDDIVTKMYVEDQENEYTKDGFVTIRRAELNPWGENYYYNFQYYVDQKLINTIVDVPGQGKKLIIDYDLENLYSDVKGLNNAIFSLNDQNSEKAIELSNLKSRLISLSTCIAAMKERLSSIDADLTKYNNEMGEPDKNELNRKRTNYFAMQEKYQKDYDDTQKIYDTIKEEYDSNREVIEAKQKEKIEKISQFESKYSQYIKEGVWSDATYVDNDTYFIDSQKVSNTSSMPQATWTISVIDGGIVEELKDFQFEVGDQTILVDNEFFGIQKNVEENYTFEVLISGITEYLDNPSKNEIEVRNYLTSFEDLFQRISAATQTLELNEQTYDKAAYFTSDGKIDADILQKTLLENALILANSTDNSYILNETGLSLQSIINPSKKLRAIADGVFLSNSLDLQTGEPEWKTGITADGINASLLTTGEINTSLIKIYSNGQPNFSWNALGITSYKFNKDTINSNSFIRLDGFGLYSIDDKTGFQQDATGAPWFKGLTRSDCLQKIIDQSTFSLTDKGFKLNVNSGQGSILLGYENVNNSSLYGLYIKDSKGKLTVKLQNNGDNQIAGWKIGDGYLYSGDATNGYTGIQSDGTVAFMAGGKNWDSWTKDAPFYVTHKGFLHSTSGEIGGWKIGETFLKSNDGKLLISNRNDPNNYFLWANGVFGVDYNGKLYARNADIEGKITATSGSFTGNIYAKSGKFDDSVVIGGTAVTAQSLRTLYEYATRGSGTQIKYISAIGGSIGGWKITEDSLSYNGTKISSGYIQLDNQDSSNKFSLSISFLFRRLTSGAVCQVPVIGFKSENDVKKTLRCIFYENQSLKVGLGTELESGDSCQILHDFTKKYHNGDIWVYLSDGARQKFEVLGGRLIAL